MSTTNTTNTTSKRLEPWDELPEDKLRKVQILADAAHAATDSMEVNLTTDVLKVPSQNWALVSFVSPTSNQKNASIGMKLRGVFDTREEATEHIKRLIKLDPMFDIFICEMYNWCLVPPDPELIADQNYQDETLNKLVSEYRKNQIFAKEHFEERKRELIEQAADEAKAAALKKLEDLELESNDNTSTPTTMMESMMNSDCARVINDLEVSDLDPIV
jgi:excinuclease UvrABC nuclease subunit